MYHRERTLDRSDWRLVQRHVSVGVRGHQTTGAWSLGRVSRGGRRQRKEDELDGKGGPTRGKGPLRHSCLRPPRLPLRPRVIAHFWDSQISTLFGSLGWKKERNEQLSTAIHSPWLLASQTPYTSVLFICLEEGVSFTVTESFYFVLTCTISCTDGETGYMRVE